MESKPSPTGATYSGITIFEHSPFTEETIKIVFEGIDQFNKGNYYEAIKYFQQVSAFHENYEGFNNIGFCYMHLGNYNEAMKYYQWAIKKAPYYAMPYRNMGACYILMDDSEKAIDSYKQAIAIYPEFVQAHIDIGLLYYRLENFIEAIKSFQRAVDCTLDTDVKARAYNYMGVILQRLGNYAKAFECFKNALEYSPNHTEAEANLGRAYARMGNYEEAIVSFQKVINREPDDVEIYFDRGNVFWKIKNYVSAQKDFTRYTFLTGIKNKHTQEIIVFFKAHTTAPFISYKLLRILSLESLQGYKQFNQQIEEQSRKVLDFLDLLQMQNFDKNHKNQYRHFLALCEFFMGDTAEAHQIFSEESEPETSQRMVTFYYHLQSAILSSLPQQSFELLKKRIIREVEVLLNDEKIENLVDIYYAGLIFLRFGKDIEKAHKCFRRSKELLPAQYMLWETEQRQRQWMVLKDIKELESRLPLDQTFVENLHPKVIGRSVSSYWSAFQHFRFYYETLDVRQKIHPSKEALPFVQFYEYWQFNLDASEEQELAAFRARRQREKIYSEIESVFNGIRAIINRQKIEEVVEGSFLLREFQSLQSDAVTIAAEKFEKIIANRIHTTARNRDFIDFRVKGFSFLEAHQMIILYFFSMDKLSARTTANLIFYAIFTAKIHNPKLLYQVAEEGSIDGIVDNIKDNDQLKEDIKGYVMLLVQSFSTTLASSLGGVFSVFLISFTLRSLTIAIQNAKNRNLHPFATEDYTQFLDEFEKQLANTRESSVYIEGLELLLDNKIKSY